MLGIYDMDGMWRIETMEEEWKLRLMPTSLNDYQMVRREGMEKKRQQQASIIIMAQSCSRQLKGSGGTSGQCKRHDPPPPQTRSE